MKATELRLGNLVKAGGLIGTVEKISADGILCQLLHTIDEQDGSKGIEPIEITEEWVIKLGFKKWKDRFMIEAWAKGHPSQRFDIDFKDGKIIMNSRYQEHSDYLVMGHIKYAHQLQNLYFALTGEELIIK